MKYPDYKTYAALYARYLKKDPSYLLEDIGALRGKRVLDLCAGEGRLSAAAVERGAESCDIVDACVDMVPAQLPLGVRPLCFKPVQEALDFIHIQSLRFDVIMCQQAVNYWFNAHCVERIAQILNKDGVLVFNTFNKKPERLPRTLEYEVDGHSFVEVRWLVADMVHHVQVREGMKPHTTEFRWVSPQEFHSTLQQHFDVVDERRNGASSIYRCMQPTKNDDENEQL